MHGLIRAPPLGHFGDRSVHVAEKRFVLAQLLLAYTQGLAPSVCGHRLVRSLTSSTRWDRAVIVVRFIENVRLRESLGVFLDASFPGSVFDREEGFALDFRAPAMSPEVELKLAERLLWAWHTQDQPAQDVELLLTASPSGSFATSEQATSVQRRLRFQTSPSRRHPRIVTASFRDSLRPPCRLRVRGRGGWPSRLR